MSKTMSMVVRAKIIASPAFCHLDIRKRRSMKSGRAMTEVYV